MRMDYLKFLKITEKIKNSKEGTKKTEGINFTLF